MKERGREGGMFVSYTDRQTDRQTETTLRRSKKVSIGAQHKSSNQTDVYCLFRNIR